MNTQDDFADFLAHLRPAPAPDSVIAHARAAAKAMQAAKAVGSTPVPQQPLLPTVNHQPMEWRQLATQQLPGLSAQLPGIAMPPAHPETVIGPLHLAQPFPTLPMSVGPLQTLSGPMVRSDGPLPGVVVFASVSPPVQDPKGVYPWPCGRTVSQADFNDRLHNGRSRIASAIPLLDSYGPFASSKACQEIIQTLLISPGTGLAELKNQRARLGPGSALGARLDTLIACGETLEDFLPFVEGMSSFFAELADRGGDPVEYPCDVAKGRLKDMIGATPALIGARLNAWAAMISPSNSTSRRFLRELNSLGDVLSGVQAIPSVPLPGMSQDEIARQLTLRILELYGKLINGSFCNCPEPGAAPLV